MLMLQTLLQEVRHKEVNANKNNEYLNAKLRDVSGSKYISYSQIYFSWTLAGDERQKAVVLKTVSAP